VLSDLADVARNLVARSARRVPALVHHEHYGRLTHMGALTSRYYLRVTLQDRPGMLARVASILGDHGISIASVMQKRERDEACAPVFIVTHASRGQDMRAALEAIDALEVVGAPTVSYRIEDFVP
jgi:homoserine dehydrogenase